MRVSCLWSRLPALAVILLVSITSILCAPALYPPMLDFQEKDPKFLKTVAEFLPNTVKRIQALRRGEGWPILYDDSTKARYGVTGTIKGPKPELKLLVLHPDKHLSQEKINRAYASIEKSTSPLVRRMDLIEYQLDGRNYLMGKEMKNLLKQLSNMKVPHKDIVELFDQEHHSRDEVLHALDDLAAEHGLGKFVTNAVRQIAYSHKSTQKKKEMGMAQRLKAQGMDDPSAKYPHLYGQHLQEDQAGTIYPSHVYQQPQFASGPSSRAGYGPFEPSEWQQSASTARHPHGGYTQFQPQLGVDYTTQNRYGPSATHPDPNQHPSYRFDTTPAYPHLPTAGQYHGSSSLGPYHPSGTAYPTHQWDHTSFPGSSSSSPLETHHDESDPRTLDLISHFGEGTS